MRVGVQDEVGQDLMRVQKAYRMDGRIVHRTRLEDLKNRWTLNFSRLVERHERGEWRRR